jgi:hypothetical protein
VRATLTGAVLWIRCLTAGSAAGADASTARGEAELISGLVDWLAKPHAAPVAIRVTADVARSVVPT